MIIKKYVLHVLIIVILCFGCVDLSLKTDQGNNIISSVKWSQKKNQLKSTELSLISFYTGGQNPKTVELTGTEKDNFINCLLTSKFYRSNWSGSIDGGMPIILNFKDGSKDTLEYCGGSVFQTECKGNLFSIKNKELEQTLLKYNVKVD
ncbi:MAG: hypothetical protein ACM3X7_09735 [Solirubrobacterales bacterium]